MFTVTKSFFRNGRTRATVSRRRWLGLVTPEVFHVHFRGKVPVGTRIRRKDLPNG